MFYKSIKVKPKGKSKNKRLSKIKTTKNSLLKKRKSDQIKWDGDDFKLFLRLFSFLGYQGRLYRLMQKIESSDYWGEESRLFPPYAKDWELEIKFEKSYNLAAAFVHLFRSLVELFGPFRQIITFLNKFIKISLSLE